MKLLSIALIFISSVHCVFSQDHHPYNARLVSWNNDIVTGRIELISDSSITIRTTRGKVFNFKPQETRRLKIWKRGINLPVALLGAIAGGVALSSGRTTNDPFFGLSITIGAVLGFIPGLITGDLISTRVNQRRMHIDSFNKIRGKIGR